MRILKEETCVLSLDIQTRLLPHIYEYEAMLETAAKLFKGMKVLDIPFLVTEQYSKALGNTDENLQKEIGDEYKPIEKMSFSCMDEPSFVSALEKTGKKNVIIAGIESHVCILQTVVDMAAEGYQTIVVADAVSSRKYYDKKIALKRMAAEGAIITTYESLLFELQRVSGTPEFKEISKIVK